MRTFDHLMENCNNMNDVSTLEKQALIFNPQNILNTPSSRVIAQQCFSLGDLGLERSTLTPLFLMSNKL